VADDMLTDQPAAFDRYLVAVEYPSLLIEQARKEEWGLVQGEEPPPPDFGADGYPRPAQPRLMTRDPLLLIPVPRRHVPPLFYEGTEQLQRVQRRSPLTCTNPMRPGRRCRPRSARHMQDVLAHVSLRQAARSDRSERVSPETPRDFRLGRSEG
jgi:hypothetical protein